MDKVRGVAGVEIDEEVVWFLSRCSGMRDENDR